MRVLAHAMLHVLLENKMMDENFLITVDYRNGERETGYAVRAYLNFLTAYTLQVKPVL